MKFFSNKDDSIILTNGLVYKENRSTQNLRIKEILIAEQHGFCAYTEKYFEPLDSSEVEHFNSSIKYKDDYYNYYATLRKPNLYKKDEDYKGSSFFQTRFYQNQDLLSQRIAYIKGEFVFEEVETNDAEARDFIKFLGLNNHDLLKARQSHCNRLKGIFRLASFSTEDILAYFRTHKNELSFITTLENELGLDLSEFY
ncbi:MAG TPA: hypothetical protein PKD51_19320 [Saprospiraceae bacterium]|nr:hypothetical protein [Saprospiraceae bacterium]HMU04580.1 hypothetical protein [Saprospiraceae bacterium]